MYPAPTMQTSAAIGPGSEVAGRVLPLLFTQKETLPLTACCWSSSASARSGCEREDGKMGSNDATERRHSPTAVALCLDQPHYVLAVLPATS